MSKVVIDKIQGKDCDTYSILLRETGEEVSREDSGGEKDRRVNRIPRGKISERVW